MAKRKPPKGPTLAEYVERYLLSRDVCAHYASYVRACCRKYCEWRGETVYVADLDCQTVNQWLVYLQSSGLAARTIHGYRAAVLAVWNEAYMNGDNEHATQRLRKIKKPRLTVVAYTQTEIRKLLTAAAALPNFYRNGVRACDFWSAAIYSAYSTGLRRGDLLAVKREQIRDDGMAVVIQSKTNYPVAVKFCDEALTLIRSFDVGEYAIPWVYEPRTFSKQFHTLRKAAGVTRGSFKWIRRSAGSYAEAQRHGDGSKLLGHRCESVFRNNYEDCGITTTEAVQPPAIVLPSVAS